jgi:hypothetical protein
MIHFLYVDMLPLQSMTGDEFRKRTMDNSYMLLRNYVIQHRKLDFIYEIISTRNIFIAVSFCLGDFCVQSLILSKFILQFRL